MLRAAMRSSFLVGIVWVVLGLSASACEQDEGEPCQTDRDCASGLECNRAVGSDRGECVGPAEEPAPDEPGALDDDAGTSDADAGTSDADGG